MNKIIAALVMLLGLAPSALAWPNTAITAGQNVTSVSAGSIQPAGPGQYTGNLVNETGLTYSNTYLLDMSQYNASNISAQAFYTSTTFSNASVAEGRTSSATITVVNYAGLASAQSKIQISVTNNFFGATLPVLTFGNCSLTMGRDYSRGATKLATAQNLATAITGCNSLVAASAAPTAVIYATATAGSYANSYAFVSNNSSITVSAATMSGGQDNAVLTINGTALTAGTNFTASVSSASTAASLATAITANSTLGAIVSVSSNVGAAYGVITLASKLNGAAYNYSITSSTSSLAIKDGALMIAGANSGMTLGRQKITASAAPGFTLGLAVLFTSSTLTSAGLVNQTTYYAVPAGGNSFYLAKYATSAVAGLSADYVTITSTNTGTTNRTYTLAPLAISGNPSMKWQVSNDNSSWDDLSVSSATFSPYTLTPTVTSWGFGTLGYRYIRANVLGPTTGGVYLKIPVQLNR